MTSRVSKEEEGVCCVERDDENVKKIYTIIYKLLHTHSKYKYVTRIMFYEYVVLNDLEVTQMRERRP